MYSRGYDTVESDAPSIRFLHLASSTFVSSSFRRFGRSFSIGSDNFSSHDFVVGVDGVNGVSVCSDSSLSVVKWLLPKPLTINCRNCLKRSSKASACCVLCMFCRIESISGSHTILEKFTAREGPSHSQSSDHIHIMDVFGYDFDSSFDSISFSDLSAVAGFRLHVN